MLFIVSGRDHAEGLTHRLQFRPQHRAYYETLGDDLILSGPYLDDKGDPIGSMIVIRRESQEAAESFAQNDPFVKEQVFASIQVSHWNWFMKRPTDLVS
ncbi:MAG: YciI family protein [Devosia sp.]